MKCNNRNSQQGYYEHGTKFNGQFLNVHISLFVFCDFLPL